MSFALAVVAASAWFGSEIPVSQWHSPGFEARLERGVLTLRGHVDNLDDISYFDLLGKHLDDDIDLRLELRRHVLLPNDWRSGIRNAVSSVLLASAGQARLDRDRLEVQIVATRTEPIEALLAQSTLPDGVVPKLTVSTFRPANRRASCERLVDGIDREPLLFESGSAELKPIYFARLNRIATTLARCRDWQLLLLGHADNFGSAAGSQSMSLRRATNVAGFLNSRGVDPDRLTASGRGAREPVADNNSWEGRNQNRRVELRLTRISD